MSKLQNVYIFVTHGVWNMCVFGDFPFVVYADTHVELKNFSEQVLNTDLDLFAEE